MANITAMLLTLALSMQVLAASPVPWPPRELHLLSQAAPAAAAVPMPAASQADLEASISELNGRIIKMRGDWPIGAIILAGAGLILAPLLLAGVPLLILGLGLGTDSFGIGPVFLVLGIGLSGVGLLGLAAGIIGIVYGSRAAAEEKQQRLELIQQRDGLQHQLDLMRAPPPAVLLFQPGQSLVTVAVF